MKIATFAKPGNDNYKDVIDKRTNKTRKQINDQTIYRIDL